MDRSDDISSEAPSRDEHPIRASGAGAADADSVRSGDFSRDPAFDPDELFEVIGREENADRVSAAMRHFLMRGDGAAFERAVATFVRSARVRAEPIEQVLALLIELAGEREGVAYPHDWTPTDLRRLVLRAVLLAFYGDDAAKKAAERAKERLESLSAPPPADVAPADAHTRRDPRAAHLAEQPGGLAE